MRMKVLFFFFWVKDRSTWRRNNGEVEAKCTSIYIYIHMYFLAALIKCAMHGKRDVGFEMIIYFIYVY